ncbi:adenylosuccinate synthase [Geoalkalibacter ferrihydriticus]|uniref:Adenylosuccinate synthetase n=1 Tax=Geoalkalibacter ferrihydriticus TaxID=392333 RepID=A0A1G9LXU6_9BACT|nr:adenylosuccinate synthetase [Geoalkalibacter ferrihydriticus]SDL66808.1 adenylosuccinate synthase [Geoalkalibacter ferrihydriticus]
MPVTVIVGGQFGGEGKGKVAHYLAREMGAKVAVRVGGSNSGHTVITPDGNPLILRQLPTPSILPDVHCVLGAGSYIDIDILFDEIAKTGLSDDRLHIDPNAVIVTDNDKRAEENSCLRKSIGSTLSGTGAALARRISRDGSTRLAKDDERLKSYVAPVVLYMRDLLSKGKRIIIEGTQGFGLSVLHSQYYPYATSRDTSAAAFVSEAGLSPLDVDDVVLVIRTYPIRVGGNSGPLKNEVDWNVVSLSSGSGKSLLELTSVTKTKRRVAIFDPKIVINAIECNNPSRIVMNHLDYICSNIKKDCFEIKASEFIKSVEFNIRKKIDYVGTSNSSLVKTPN